MTYVVQEPCVGCKAADCIDVCPVECIFEDIKMVIIHPEECIECGACAAACPVEAIVPDEEAEEIWIQKAQNFDFKEDLRRSSSSQVSKEC